MINKKFDSFVLRFLIYVIHHSSKNIEKKLGVAMTFFLGGFYARKYINEIYRL